MKKIYSILTVLAVPAILLFYSYTSGSPGGKSGSPGDNGKTCTQCHSGSAQTATGLITTNIPETGYVSGETYTIMVSAQYNNITKYGFELTAEDGAGDKKGGFAITEASRTKLTNGGHAVTHKSGGTGANGNSISWSVDWTAPESGTGDITFYTALNATNNNGSTSGDQIYKSSLTVTEQSANPQIISIVPDIIAQDFVGSVTISGNETSWENEVESVTFKLHDNSDVSFDAESFSVVNNEEIEAVMPSLLDQQTGVYDVYVDDLVLENGLTITVANGVNDIASYDKINLFPNPAVNSFTVKLPAGSNIEIYSILGEKVFSKLNTGEIEQFNIRGLKQGVYIVSVTYNGKNIQNKLLIQR